MKRYGQILKLRPEHEAEYVRQHAAVWPEVLERIRRSNIRNYSIYYNDGQLFGYFEYHGPDAEFAARMKRLGEAPRMREWWDVTEPLQIPRTDRKPGDWWTNMEEVFHLD